MEVGTIVRVAVDVAMDRPLDYSVPLHLQGAVRLGSHVLVPLASREVTGFVVGFPEDSFPNLRPVLGLVHPEPLLRPATVALAEWIARYYCCPLEMALRTVLPCGRETDGRRYRWPFRFPSRHLKRYGPGYVRVPRSRRRFFSGFGTTDRRR